MKTSVVGSGGPTGLDEQLIFTLFIQVGSVWSVLLHDDEDYTTSVTVFSDRDPGVTAGLILGVLKPVGPHTQSICYVGFFFLFVWLFLFLFLFFQRPNVLRDENVFTHSTAWERAERRPCKSTIAPTYVFHLQSPTRISVVSAFRDQQRATVSIRPLDHSDVSKAHL